MTTAVVYEQWSLVFINAMVFILFALCVTPMRMRRDWCAFLTFSVFMIAHFVEMYGFPLTWYGLARWGFDSQNQQALLTPPLDHHWLLFIGLSGSEYLQSVLITSTVLILSGYGLLAWAGKQLFIADHTSSLALSGPYVWCRHPQYLGFILIMSGFVVQWPTLITLLLLLLQVPVYLQLAHREETGLLALSPKRYQRYWERTPGFMPRWRKRQDRESA